jgi:hypothetical protein
MTRRDERRCGRSSHRVLASVSLRLLPRHHFTGCPSPKRYDNRYEVQGRENFGGLRQREVRRIPLKRTSENSSSRTLVNKPVRGANKEG